MSTPSQWRSADSAKSRGSKGSEMPPAASARSPAQYGASNGSGRPRSSMTWVRVALKLRTTVSPVKCANPP